MLVVAAGVEPAGKRLRLPADAPCVTVTFTATARTPKGMPQRPPSVRSLSVFATSAGPPQGPAGYRVSETRHGVSGWNVAPETGGGGEMTPILYVRNSV